MFDGVMAAALGVLVIGILSWWHLYGGSNGGHRKTLEAAYGHPGSPAGRGAGTNAASTSPGSGPFAFALNPYANSSQGLVGAQNVTHDQMLQAMMRQQAAAQKIGMYPAANTAQQDAYFQALHQKTAALQQMGLVGPPPPSPPVAPPKIADAGIHLGEIEAWRAWRIVSGFVRSTYRDEVWAPGEAMTGKPATGHGVHAWPTMSAALTYGVGQNADAIVIGRVHLWGEVIEHERGYRAEFAKIIAFDAIVAPRAQAAEINTALATLRNRYRLPATTIEAGPPKGEG